MKYPLSILVVLLAAFLGTSSCLRGGFILNPHVVIGPPKFNITDLTSTQGGDGWSAGYLGTNNNPSTFSTSGMTWSAPNWVGTQSFSTPVVGAVFMHPGVDSENSAAARFVAPSALSGTITLKASSAGSDVTMRVWQGAVLLGSLSLTGSTSTLTVPGVTLGLADTITVECDPNADSSGDSTTITEFTLR